MNSHYIKKCSKCDTTISQCRCPGEKATRYAICDKCSDGEKLANEIDQSLIDRDDRKPFRKVMDDKVIPAAGLALGAGAAAVGAVTNLQTVHRLKELHS